MIAMSPEFIVGWLILSAAVGGLAHKRGQSFWMAFIGGALLSPVLMLIAVLLTPKNQKVLEERALNQGEARKCPFCAELVKPEAAVCRHCGKDIPERPSTLPGVRQIPR